MSPKVKKNCMLKLADTVQRGGVNVTQLFFYAVTKTKGRQKDECALEKPDSFRQL